MAMSNGHIARLKGQLGVHVEQYLSGATAGRSVKLLEDQLWNITRGQILPDIEQNSYRNA